MPIAKSWDFRGRGGKERSAREWRELFASGGSEMKRIVPVVDVAGERQDVSIVEAAPAPRGE